MDKRGQTADDFRGLDVYDQRPREPGVIDRVLDILLGSKGPYELRNLNNTPPIDDQAAVRQILRDMMPERTGLEKDPLVIHVPKFHGPGHDFLVAAGVDDKTPALESYKSFQKPVHPTKVKSR